MTEYILHKTLNSIKKYTITYHLDENGPNEKFVTCSELDVTYLGDPNDKF